MRRGRSVFVSPNDFLPSPVQEKLAILPSGRCACDLALSRRCITVPAMSTITIPMPDEDLVFLRAYSSALGTSAEAFLARQAHNLRRHLQQPVQGDVEAASGIISPRINAEHSYREHLGKKHG
jgi:hypothetical protein